MDHKAIKIKALTPPLVRSVISPLGTIPFSAKRSSNQSDPPMFAYYLSICQEESDSEKTNGEERVIPGVDDFSCIGLHAALKKRNRQRQADLFPYQRHRDPVTWPACLRLATLRDA
jgi:hypothetical protein